MVKVFERAAEIAALKGTKKADVDHLYLVAARAADDRKDVVAATVMRKKILSGISPEDDHPPRCCCDWSMSPGVPVKKKRRALC